MSLTRLVEQSIPIARSSSLGRVERAVEGITGARMSEVHKTELRKAVEGDPGSSSLDGSNALEKLVEYIPTEIVTL